uniref:NADH dehydrogenase [ubiquinone] 1 beta subcomplex subunit 10 n=1 Tax=Macrostomum lignano TaxID=282301 RepID=A0A1I8IVH6_9PLAT
MGGGHEPEPTRESLYTPVTSKAFTDTWLFKAFDLPTTWFKENVIDKYRKKYPYYHRRYPRVPTIDQCFVDDELCNLEADEQYKRDRLSDRKTSTNYFIKHGDMGYAHNVKNALMKQKHRMLWERKYGEVGSRGDPNKYPNVIDMEPGTLEHEDTLIGNMRKFGNNHDRNPKEMAP